MPSPAGPAELLSDLAAALAAIGARWYVFGAQAALVWGRPRLTTDVDVTVKCPTSTEQLVATLEASGFSLRIDATKTFIRSTRVVPLEHRQSGLALDVVLAGPGLEDEFLERAVPVEVAGTMVPFISPEDLIVTKLLAGREKDIEDVRGVLSERVAELDVEQIRTTLRLLEAALGQSDLMPAFDAELARWRRGARDR
ncbi:MAG: nucleotidyl transferase AbiEii/AbiGii toxin family protein [Vicinamibacterales bacterium]